MGATLPTLTRHLTTHAADLSAAFGRLYAANTIGAIVGPAVAGFVLIELLGLTGTLLVGAACSGTAGIVALVLDRVAGRAATRRRRPRRRRARVPAATIRPPAGAAGSAAGRRLALALAFVSGLTSLAYQVLWTRLIASGTGNSTYVFTLILVVFLVGIALGALAFTSCGRASGASSTCWRPRQIADRRPRRRSASSSSSTASSARRLDLTTSIGELLGDFAQQTILIVLPATFVMGLTLPGRLGLVAGDDGEIGSRAGLLLAVNTLGRDRRRRSSSRSSSSRSSGRPSRSGSSPSSTR